MCRSLASIGPSSHSHVVHSMCVHNIALMYPKQTRSQRTHTRTRTCISICDDVYMCVCVCMAACMCVYATKVASALDSLTDETVCMSSAYSNNNKANTSKRERKKKFPPKKEQQQHHQRNKWITNQVIHIVPRFLQRLCPSMAMCMCANGVLASKQWKSIAQTMVSMNIPDIWVGVCLSGHTKTAHSLHAKFRWHRENASDRGWNVIVANTMFCVCGVLRRHRYCYCIFCPLATIRVKCIRPMVNVLRDSMTTTPDSNP